MSAFTEIIWFRFFVFVLCVCLISLILKIFHSSQLVTYRFEFISFYFIQLYFILLSFFFPLCVYFLLISKKAMPLSYGSSHSWKEFTAETSKTFKNPLCHRNPSQAVCSHVVYLSLSYWPSCTKNILLYSLCTVYYYNCMVCALHCVIVAVRTLHCL